MVFCVIKLRKFAPFVGRIVDNLNNGGSWHVTGWPIPHTVWPGGSVTTGGQGDQAGQPRVLYAWRRDPESWHQHWVLMRLIFLGPQGSWIVWCLYLKIQFRFCAWGHQWCGIIHDHWWTASIKPRLLFSQCRLCFPRALPFSQLNYTCIKCYELLTLNMWWEM